VRIRCPIISSRIKGSLRLLPTELFETSAAFVVRLPQVSLWSLLKSPDTRPRPGVSGCSSLSCPKETVHAPIPDARSKPRRTSARPQNSASATSVSNRVARRKRPLNALGAAIALRTSLPPPTSVMAALYGLSDSNSRRRARKPVRTTNAFAFAR
jgi:hypothetical protein